MDGPETLPEAVPACTDVMRLVSDSVPVPEVLYAEPPPAAGLPPYRLTLWIDAITFRDLKRAGDTASCQ